MSEKGSKKGKKKGAGDKLKDSDKKEPLSEEETIPNPNFYFGNLAFTLENGDVFDGGYGCHKSGIIWREGWGVYATKDGHVYQGEWENDQLLVSDETAILYPTGHKYVGGIRAGQYSGPGIYILDNHLILTAEFKENKPVTTITMQDYDGHEWKGESYDTHSIILSVNHFFETIPPSRGLGTYVPPEKGKNLSRVSFAPSKESLKDEGKLKQLLFKKSSKTKNDFKAQLQQYSDLQLKSKQQIDSRPSQRTTVFFADEPAKTSLASKMSISLLKTFLSREYRNRCEAMPVFTGHSPEPEQEPEILQDG